MRKLRLVISYLCLAYTALILYIVMFPIITRVEAFNNEQLLILAGIATESAIASWIYYPHKK
jgi:predicted ABC-type exoprotein transport system permease subunit